MKTDENYAWLGVEPNLQSRVLNVFVVSEDELDALGSFNYAATLLTSVAALFAGIAISAFQKASGPWTMSDCFAIVGGAAVAIALFIWSGREVLLRRSLVQRIKGNPKPARNRQGDS